MKKIIILVSLVVLLALSSIFILVNRTDNSSQSQTEQPSNSQEVKIKEKEEKVEIDFNASNEDIKKYFYATEVLDLNLPYYIQIKTNYYCPESQTENDYIVPENYEVLSCRYDTNAYYNKKENQETIIELHRSDYPLDTYDSLDDFCNSCDSIKSFYGSCDTEARMSLHEIKASKVTIRESKLVVGTCSIHDEINWPFFILSEEGGKFKKIFFTPYGFLFDDAGILLKQNYFKDFEIIDIDNDGISEIYIYWEICSSGGCKDVHQVFSLKNKEFYSLENYVVVETGEKFKGISSVDYSKNIDFEKNKQIKEFLYEKNNKVMEELNRTLDIKVPYLK